MLQNLNHYENMLSRAHSNYKILYFKMLGEGKAVTNIAILEAIQEMQNKLH